MRVDPRSLVRKLTPTATRALEAAVGRAAQGGYYELSVEHLLSALLEPDAGDVPRLFQRWSVDRRRLWARVERELGSLKQGNPGRPVISESVFRWLEDAWLLASVELGALKLRTGHLLRAAAREAGALPGDGYAELDELQLAEVRRDLAEVLAPSPETAEASLGPRRPRRPGRRRGAARRRRRARALRDELHPARPRREDRPDLRPPPGDPAGASTSSRAAARTTRSSSASRASGRPRSSRASPSPSSRGDVPDALQDVELLGLDLGLLQAGAEREGRVREPAQGGDRRGEGVAEARSSCSSTRRTRSSARAARPGGERRGEPPEARARARRAAHHRRDHLVRVQEVLREGRRPRAPLPAGEGGRAASEDDAVLMLRGLARRLREGARRHASATRRSSRGGARSRGATSPGAPAPGQGGRPARHRLPPG